MEQRYLHMTLFWGRKTEVLFRGWPGARGGMYALALVVMFLLTFCIEMLSYHRLSGRGLQRRNPALAGIIQTVVHAIQAGLAYLLMLALMSYNIGVILVAIAGSTAGFLVFHSSIFLRAETPEAERTGEVTKGHAGGRASANTH